MAIIRLPQGNWEIDLSRQLGSEGGFGTVYVGSREGFPPLAIKRLHVTSRDSASRELRIAEQLTGRDLKYIIPIYDSGQDAESDFYYVVMAKAERNLREELNLCDSFEEIAVANILLQVVAGLKEVINIVHRDLKPENLLFHDGVWKIGDFGIAKFVEESTSLQTLKGCLTPPYAAPEQWQLSQVGTATDLYSLGCIAYELISGHTPFQATTFSEYQDLHVLSEPPALQTKNPLLRSLISMLLRKNPESRPSIDRVQAILEHVINNSIPNNQVGALGALAQAGALAAERALAIEAKAQAEEASLRKRHRVVTEAFQILHEITQEFFTEIFNQAPTVEMYMEPKGTSYLSLGNNSIAIKWMNEGLMFPANSFSESKWDVVCGAIIAVTQDDPKYIWSSNLWYTNLGADTSYRWYETSYWQLNANRFVPFALSELRHADLAHSNIMHSYLVATKPKPIDGENFSSFVERWSELFVRALNGQLTPPRRLPID